MKKTKTYKATLDTGEGGETSIEAHDISQAFRLAAKWAEAGDWTVTEQHIIRLYSEDGEEFLGERSVTIQATVAEAE